MRVRIRFLTGCDVLKFVPAFAKTMCSNFYDISHSHTQGIVKSHLLTKFIRNGVVEKLMALGYKHFFYVFSFVLLYAASKSPFAVSKNKVVSNCETK